MKQRYVVHSSFPSSGTCKAAARIIPLGSNAVYLVECDDEQFAVIADNFDLVLPSLDAPADKMSADTLAFFSANGVIADSGDALLNLLRKLRDAQGISFQAVSIDKPY